MGTERHGDTAYYDAIKKNTLSEITQEQTHFTEEIAFDGGVTGNITTVSVSSYPMIVTDYILHVAYTVTGACFITLPTAQALEGRIITIKGTGNESVNNITVSPQGVTETIDGDTEWIINGNYDWIKLYSDGRDWFIIN